ncbi:hypothetical protein ACUM5Y_07230 [Marinomonas dokdonensis]|uniref:hypothetical protein n=1 Tax=Marinomonas dokdonensis TaxID=328224 RepID=UPI0040553A4E
MWLDISRGSYRLVEFNQASIRGLNALGENSFVLSLQGARTTEKARILNIRISIFSKGDRNNIASNLSSNEQLIELNGHPGNQSLSFSVSLTNEQLLAIEDYRQFGDLALHCRLEALVLSEDGDIRQSNSDSDYHIPQQEWVKALNQSGFQDSYLYEIPLPATISDIKAMLSKAQSCIDIGDYQNAVMECRRIIERVEELRGDHSQARTASNKLKDNGLRKGMTANERALALREGVKNICQLGAHGSEEFSRSQARMILGMTLTLLSEPTVGSVVTKEG